MPTLLIVAGASLSAIADDVQVTAFPVTAPPDKLKLDKFYKKHVSANGYPVVSSEKVNDYALKEAAFLINKIRLHETDHATPRSHEGLRPVEVTDVRMAEAAQKGPQGDPGEGKESWPHQGKGNVILFPASSPSGSGDAPIQCRERLGGLLKYYYREAG